MRHLLLSFAAVLVLTPPVHADQIDDLTLTSAHHTFTFSLPATSTFPDHPHNVSFTEKTPGVVDGSPGYTFDLTFFTLPELSFPAIELTYGPPADAAVYLLSGPDLTSNPVNPTFPLNTFHYSDFLSGYSYPGQVFDGPYTLTITPESAVSTTPEPSTLALLATGSLGLVNALRRPWGRQLTRRVLHG